MAAISPEGAAEAAHLSGLTLTMETHIAMHIGQLRWVWAAQGGSPIPEEYSCVQGVHARDHMARAWHASATKVCESLSTLILSRSKQTRCTLGSLAHGQLRQLSCSQIAQAFGQQRQVQGAVTALHT